MEEVERSGPSVEEALEVALEELGASEQEVVVEIVQEPRSGVLGIGAQDAVVRVRLKARGEELSEDELEEQAEIACEFLEGLLERMDIAASVEPGLEDGSMYVDLLGEGDEQADDDMALLIGRHGQTLDALQELTRVVVGRRTEGRCRVIVDVEDYRKRRRRRLEGRARDLAKRVQRSGREEALEPLTAFERKIVHDAVSGVSGVTTESRGEEPERYVVIRPSG